MRVYCIVIRVWGLYVPAGLTGGTAVKGGKETGGMPGRLREVIGGKFGGNWKFGKLAGKGTPGRK